MKKTLKLITSIILLAALAFTACSGREKQKDIPSVLPETSSASETAALALSENEESSEQPQLLAAHENEEEPQKKNKDIVILATSDVHCSPQRNFGYTSLYRIREKFLKEGCEVILVDNGDEVEGHGEMFGTVTRGKQVIELMNKMGYDVATPGNHDFNYGADRFIELTKMADYPYVSCNVLKNGKLVFQPYIIKEVAGKKIAFIGATTPRTIGYYSSTSLFKNGNGKVVYSMRGGSKNKKLFAAIQAYTNQARAAGADYVFLLSHFGKAKKYDAWDNIDALVAATKGIDGVFDGHSHDSKKLDLPNAEGKMITRIAMGSKLSRIGYLRISGEDGSIKMNIFSWTTSSVTPSELFGIKNEMTEEVDKALAEFKNIYTGKIGTNNNPLFISNPDVAVPEGETPPSIITRAETNLGDFVADAMRITTGADVALIPSDKIKATLPQGDICMKDLYNVLPSSKMMITVNATGQQILDALEWSVRTYPKPNSAFLQVSGITFKVNTKTKTPCKKKSGALDEIKGKRRVSNVKIAGVAIDPKKTYTVTSYLGVIRNANNGYNMFKKCKQVRMDGRLDFQLLTDFVKINLNGVIGDRYMNPRGSNRITSA